MIDALMYAARNTIRAGGIAFGVQECDISDDGRPTPRAGGWFASVHGGRCRSDRDNQLMEYYDFSVTLTMRVVVALDQVGTAQIARDIARVPVGERQGFNAKVDQLRRLLHMNWKMTVLPGQTPPSANDNLSAWLDAAAYPNGVYGFIEPARYRGVESPSLVGGEWFGAELDARDERVSTAKEEVGIKAELRFEGALRMQPQTAAVGPFA